MDERLKNAAGKAEEKLEAAADSLYGRAMQSKHGWILLALCLLIGFAAGKLL